MVTASNVRLRSSSNNKSVGEKSLVTGPGGPKAQNMVATVTTRPQEVVLYQSNHLHTKSKPQSEEH